MAGMAAREPVLEMRKISKAYPGVQALDAVSLQLEKGEVLALVGENGAGKSTLIKILGGALLPDSGEVVLGGRVQRMLSPTAARQAGLAIIYQEFNLVPGLTVRENIFLGRERTRWGLVRSQAERGAVRELCGRIGFRLDPERRCAELSVAEQQMVEIAKALSVEARIIVMDEPTAALTSQETDCLLALIGQLKARGLSVIYISHRLEEVFAVADRVLVLRDGQEVGTARVADVSRAGLIEMMVGRPLEQEFPRRAHGCGPERLRVEHLCCGRLVRDVSFHVCAGEVVGFAGLAGAGRTETMRAMIGADRAESGRILIRGRETVIRSPRAAIRHGICLLTEDRKRQGLVLAHSVQANFGLPNLERFRRGPWLDQRREVAELARFVQDLKIKLTGPQQPAGQLSGGNQQKVVLAKWLAGHADIVIFDEPTRGIDVGAKYELYLLINRLATAGKAIIMVSSELLEVLGMSDRILVMHEGRITGQITDVARATQQDVLALAIA